MPLCCGYCHKELSSGRWKTCPHCHRKLSKNDIVDCKHLRCPRCEGKGKVPGVVLEGRVITWLRCPKCKGSGRCEE